MYVTDNQANEYTAVLFRAVRKSMQYRAKRCFYQRLSVQSLEGLVYSQAKKENVNLILNLGIEERYF